MIVSDKTVKLVQDYQVIKKNATMSSGRAMK